MLLGFGVLAVVMTFPHLSRFSTSVPGDFGDPMFVLWTLRWVSQAAPNGWSSLWNAGIFSPAANTLAYSDNLAPMAALHWPLSQILGDVGAFNVIFVGSWVVSLWSMYLLGLHVTRQWQASVVAAVGFTFATVRLAQYGHHQLVVGCLFPLLILGWLRLFEKPSVWRGAGVGAIVAVITLWASYYGVAAAILSALMVLGLALFRRPWVGRSHLIALVAAGVVALVLVAPFARQYLVLQEDPHFRRTPEAAFAAHPPDLFAVSAQNDVLARIPPFESFATDPARSGESRLFPGIVVTLAAAVGVVGILVMFRRRRQLTAGEGSGLIAVVLVGAIGVVFLVFSFGDTVIVLGHTVSTQYEHVRGLIPGLDGIRVTARFFIITQLALALLATVGLAFATRRLSSRWRSVVMVGLVAFVMVETATTVSTVTVPSEARYGAVGAALSDRPPGRVLELPILSSTDGIAWAYVEGPRQSLLLPEGFPRVNGYSGFDPPGFPVLAATLNRFPAADALAEADHIRVRYVVLRTELVGALPKSLIDGFGLDQVGRYTDAQARVVIAAVPPDRVKDVTRVRGAYVVELAPAA